MTSLKPASMYARRADSEHILKGLMISSNDSSEEDFSPNDEENPRNWSVKRKCAIAFFANFSAGVATLGIPIYVSGIPGIVRSFHVDTTLAIAPISVYSWGLGLGALLGTAACEIFGRSIVYRVSIPISLVFTVVGGSARTYATVATARGLAGLFSGPCLSVAAGVLNDLWDLSLEITGTSFAVILVLMQVFATMLGPMVSSSLVTYHSWRWTFWTSSIILAILSTTAFFIPETYKPEILRRRAKRNNAEVSGRGKSLDIFLISVGRPLHMLLVEPLIAPSGLVLAVNQSIAFAYYVVYALLFEEVYHFSQYEVGMTFAPLLVGGIIGVPVVAVFDKLTYQKSRVAAIESGTTVSPETRLYPAMMGVILLPVSLFWLAWTCRPQVHWIVPALSGVLFGIGYLLNFMCMPVYNNDVYFKHYGASVLAATTFLRLMISSAFPLFTAQMVHKIGLAWAISVLGFIAVAMIPIPWVFSQWGPALRSRSRYLIHVD